MQKYEKINFSKKTFKLNKMAYNKFIIVTYFYKKYMKKYVLIFLIIISLIIPIKYFLFADDSINKNWYELYKQRVTDICDWYNPEKKIFITKDYKKAYTKVEEDEKIKMGENEIEWHKAFETAKNTYEENMNNIYKCAILNSQFSSLNLIKNDILTLSKNDKLSSELKWELEKNIDRIKISIDTLKCRKITNNNDPIQKKSILKQTSYELCKYHSYLEYLREYNSNYENIVVLDDNKNYNSMFLVNLEKDRKNQIDIEINQIYKVFPIAFDAYKQYEDNLSTHILLGLIKKDYKVLRDTLHKTLNPINQVWYKIINAMQE